MIYPHITGKIWNNIGKIVYNLIPLKITCVYIYVVKIANNASGLDINNILLNSIYFSHHSLNHDVNPSPSILSTYLHFLTFWYLNSLFFYSGYGIQIVL